MSQLSVTSPIKLNLEDDARSICTLHASCANAKKMKNIVNLFDLVELYEEVTEVHPEKYYEGIQNKYFLIKHSDIKYEFMPVSQMSWFINMEFNKDIKLWKVYGTRTKY
jgi:hypothetical protein